MSDDFVKGPGETLDYARDWKYRDTASRAAGGAGNGWLAAGETITTSTWTVETGLTETTPSPTNVDGLTTIWLLGGTADQNYTVTNTVTTSAGRIGVRSITVSVRNR